MCCWYQCVLFSTVCGILSSTVGTWWGGILVLQNWSFKGPHSQNWIGFCRRPIFWLPLFKLKRTCAWPTSECLPTMRRGHPVGLVKMAARFKNLTSRSKISMPDCNQTTKISWTNEVGIYRRTCEPSVNVSLKSGSQRNRPSTKSDPILAVWAFNYKCWLFVICMGEAGTVPSQDTESKMYG